MRTTTSLLLLPLLASSSLTLSIPRKHKSQFKRIYRERAGALDVGTSSSADAATTSVAASSTVTPAPSGITATSTGIPVASTTASVADSLSPFEPSSSNTTSSSNSTGLDTVNPNPGNLSSETLSSLLAQTTAFQSFTFTDYVAASTTSSASSAVVTGSSSSWDGGDAGSDGGNGSDGSDDDSSNAGPSSSGSAYDDVMQAAKSYAQSMMETLMPTLTLEVILEPTQVCPVFCCRPFEEDGR